VVGLSTIPHLWVWGIIYLILNSFLDYLLDGEKNNLTSHVEETTFLKLKFCKENVVGKE
jgi:hypothetical protein